MSLKLLIYKVMNKYVLSIALLVASTGAFAQNRLVKKAQGLINNNQIEEAQTSVSYTHLRAHET